MGMFGRYIILFIGVAAGAVSIVFIKASSLHPVALASFRQLLAAFLLLPLYLKSRRGVERATSRRAAVASILPGLALGCHFITWITGARMTFSANATLIVNMVPVIMPLFAFLFIREVMTGMEIAGTVCAMAGVLFLSITDFHLSAGSFRGDLLCFLSMIFFALYLILGKKQKGDYSLWLYLVPLYAIGGLFCFGVSLLFVTPFQGVTLFEAGMIAGLAAISTIGGHSILNFSMRHLRSQLVSLVNLSQVLFAALFGLLFFSEIPDFNFFIATPVIAGGIALAVIFSGRKRKGRPSD